MKENRRGLSGRPSAWQVDQRVVEAAMSKKTDREREEISEDDVQELAAIVEIPDAFMFQSIMTHPSAQMSTLDSRL